MTTETVEQYDDQDDSEKVVTVRRSEIRALEKKAKERDEYAKKVETLTKRQTFAEAGIDLKDPKTEYFLKGYEGELTVEAIRERAIADGFLAAEQPDPAKEAELDATGKIVSAAAGATPRGAMDEATMRSEMEAAEAQGGPEAIMAVARKYGAVAVEDFQ